MLNFKTALAAFAVGRRANAEEWNATSHVLADATLGFGVPAVAGTAAGTISALTAAGQNILGITEAVAVLAHVGDNFVKYDTVPVCEQGVIGVMLDAAVAAGAQARFNTATNMWTSAAASASVLTVPGAQFDQAGASGAVGVVRFRRPVPCVSA